MSATRTRAHTLSHWERVAAQQPGEGLQSPTGFIDRLMCARASIPKTETFSPPPAAPSSNGRGFAPLFETRMRRSRRVRTRNISSTPNFFDHPIESLLDLVIGETKLNEAVTFNNLAPGSIAPDLITMLLAVEFDRQSKVMATEIRDEITNWTLPTKLQSIEPAVTKLSPQHVLSRRAVGPQTSCYPYQSVRHARQFDRRNLRSQPLTRRLRRHPLPLGEGGHHAEVKR
ncbi:hypothetical protein MHY1_01229 [Methylovirgula sp. HY1]|nr:hypothetical protein MHY1_01229 [Methylovirgula sp. HY1]